MRQLQCDWLFRFTTVVDDSDTVRDVQDGLILSGPVTLYVQWYTLPFFHDRLSRMRLLLDDVQYAHLPDTHIREEGGFRANEVLHWMGYRIDTRLWADGPHRLAMVEYDWGGQHIIRSNSLAVVFSNITS